ncbi:MAG: ribosome small subunit-dependent GTPase A [Armatimonadetes bacterium]|nr:ribosome small subunit-dependent GTPase A [Armatimonadota bacterium]
MKLTSEQINQLRETFKALPKIEQKRLLAEARRRKDLFQSRLSAKTNRAERFLDEEDRSSFQRAPKLDVERIAVELLAEEQREPDSLSDLGPIILGQVVWVGPRSYQIRVGTSDNSMEIHPALVPALGGRLCVGDHVRTSGGNIVGLEARTTLLSRRDGQTGEPLLIAANIDAAVVVVSVVAPPLHPRIIDRYLVAIRSGGAEPMLFVNKADLLDESNRWELDCLAAYRSAGMPIVVGSAERGDSIRELRAHLRGKTCVFVGHSGVGKSSLVNALAPSIHAKVGSVSEGYGRGTHTTTASSLYEIGDEICVIDTPGVRSFQLDSMDPLELASYFPEFVGLADHCRYRDCAHIHEPRCAIKAAVEAGDIPEERYDAYLRLLGIE